MKITITPKLHTWYDDGVGNTGRYTYTLNDITITVIDANIWKINSILVKVPANEIVGKVASVGVQTASTPLNLSAGGGTLPAASGRTVDVSKAGILTFADTDEIMAGWEFGCSFSEIPVHEYGFDIFIDHEKSGEYDRCVISSDGSLWTTVTNIAPIEPITVEDISAALTGGITYYILPNASDIANNQMPQDMEFGWVEEDLLSRPYNGMLIEVAAKALIAARKLRRKAGMRGELGQLGVFAPEVAGYLRGDGPLDMHYPSVQYLVAISG